MDVIAAKIEIKKIKFSLIFFCVIILFISCSEQKAIEHLEVNYQNEQAVSVLFKSSEGIAAPEIFIAGTITTPVLGQLMHSESGYRFTPVIPFSKGQRYEIRSKGKLLTSFAIDLPDKSELGVLSAIYPTRDTVPENLLKMYLQFAQPMQEVGEVLSFISVNDETTGEFVSIFLELESELWNKTHDRLTLWLDPGRIKTDLIPNRENGLPILEGREYLLSISKEWKTAQGMPLKKDYSKKLVVTARDSKRPNPENWKILPPTVDEHGPLQIIFEEPLDAILVMETLTILTDDGQLFPGDFMLGEREMNIAFRPVNIWNKGIYKILIESKLEDLAGNNLNRLFDTDVIRNQEKLVPQKFYQLQFKITE